ncbi:MAG: NifU family protein [Mycobacterium sp.]
MSSPKVVALHAERVAGEPAAVRWVVPAGLVPGRVVSAPGELGALFADGTLTAGLVEHAAVWLWLRDGLTWREHGRAVQDALRRALAEPRDWVIEPAPGEVLERVAEDVLGGTVGDFVSSHGGTTGVHRVDDELVAVELGGACKNCPAADHTLRQRLLQQLRRRCPDVTEVERTGGRLLLTLRKG